MAMLFGVASGNPAATVAARVAYLFAWHPECRAIVWRARDGRLRVARDRGQFIRGTILASYRRDVRISDIVDDVRFAEPGCAPREQDGQDRNPKIRTTAGSARGRAVEVAPTQPSSIAPAARMRA